MTLSNENYNPGTITSIEPQKRNRGRYSIFIDDEFRLGISETVLLEFNLQKGDYLTSGELKEVFKSEAFSTVKNYCYTLLSNRNHTRKELYVKAKKKGYDRRIINNVLDTFEENDILNPEEFARSFARDKNKLNKWGPRKITSALIQKGIDKNLAYDAANEVVTSKEIYSILERLLKKKRNRLLREADSRKRRKKAFDYLRRKGYYTQQIIKHLDELMDSLNL